jgi:cyclopropane fatty-acyl-phospholipid synthase-like methyltransferase
LRFDPVFLTILRKGLIPGGARVLDLGCGQGLLLSLLSEAGRRRRDSPSGCPAVSPPLQLFGIERDPRAAQWARASLAGRATIETADLRQAYLPHCDIVVLLDVLHYLSTDEQRALLQRVANSLSNEGRILLRVFDATARPSLTLVCDRIGTLLRGQAWPRYHVRPVREWRQLLAEIGFDSEAQTLVAGTPFRNVLLVAKRR